MGPRKEVKVSHKQCSRTDSPGNSQQCATQRTSTKISSTQHPMMLSFTGLSVLCVTASVSCEYSVVYG